MKKVRNYIDGAYCQAESSKTITSITPAHATVAIGTAPLSGAVDVERAVLAARKAFPAWRGLPAPKRGEILYRAAENILKEKEELARIVSAEMGKIIAEGRSDVQEAIDIAYYMAGEGRRLSAETVPSELAGKDCKSVREAIGVFALITPWNFPTAIPAWKIFPALIAGNTVVLKPSSYTPVAAARLIEIINDAGLPPGVLNLLNGSGEEAGALLAAHAGIDGISFTGSSKVGEQLLTLSASLTKEISCEMGGKNPIIVMDDARIDLAVEGALWGAFGTAGQRCTASSRIIVHKDILDEFTETFRKAASALKLGDPLSEDTDVGPLINEEQMKKVLKYIETGISEGACLTLGGRQATANGLSGGYFIEPTIFTGVKASMRIAQEEIFGPLTAIIEARDLEDAIGIANGVDYGLAASIYTQDVNNSATAERDLDAGIVYVNAPTIGAEIQLPFGGYKKSGLGHKEAGGMGGAIDLFTKLKVIYRDFSGKLQKAQMEK